MLELEGIRICLGIVMRFTAPFFAILLGLSMAFSLQADAQRSQQSGRVVYGGGDSTSGSSSIYNSPSTSYNSRGPLSIRQILEGKTNASSTNQTSYYGGSNFRPYGVDNNNYSINLSSEQISAYRQQRDILARQREEESLSGLQEASLGNIEGQTSDYLNQFQSDTSQTPNVYMGKPRYKKRESGFEKPRKVFNSVR